ncbi:MAG: FHA domain-containing protein [Armatimonadetes bacterium]|nr:FHA domain-containing protein [Anaerolineae bacterium]
MRRGPEINRVYPLTQDTVQIGRGVKNDIVIIDNEVSREHCRFTRTDTGYDLVDLESSNGTFVNGQRINLHETVLLPADCIVEIGDSITLEYKSHDIDLEMSTQKVALSPELEANTLPAFLVVIAHSQPLPAVYPLDGDTIDVGRGTTNNVIIVEPEISRNHLRLSLSKRGYLIQDLDSTNGTSVNGVMLKGSQLLHDGDVIRIGTTIVIRFTTNPHVFTSKKATDVLKDRANVNEPTRMRSTLPMEMTTALRGMITSPSQMGTGIEPGALIDQIFLAYARSDWETIVAPMVDRLYNLDLPVWVEQYLTPGGDDWRVALEQARSECWLLLLVVTHTSMEVEYIQKIWRHFQNREKAVVLVMVDDLERLPIGGSAAHKLQYDPLHPDNGLRQLVHTIKQLQK